MSEQAAALRYNEREIEEMDTQDLLRLYKETGDESLKWPLVLRYEGLIKNAAMQIRGVYSSFAQIEDIINEGIITLLGAVDKFDPDKGVKFETSGSGRRRSTWPRRSCPPPWAGCQRMERLPSIWASPRSGIRRTPPTSP